MSSFNAEQVGINSVVMEFWSGCGQMDLASACVLRFNRLVDLRARGEVKVVVLIG